MMERNFTFKEINFIHRMKNEVELQGKKEEEGKKTRSQKSEISWGNQIRSYIMQPYTMVKDHRTKVEISDVGSILNGNLDKLLEAQLILLS